MMRFLVLLIISVTSIFTQYLSWSEGYFLTHSDNKILATKDHDWSWLHGIQGGFEMKLSRKVNLLSEISYYYAENKKATKLPLDMYQTTIPFDISCMLHESVESDYGAGLSLAWSSRELRLSDYQYKEKINAFSLGGSAQVRWKKPWLFQKWGAFVGLKLRYLKSFYFDAPGRNVKNYHLDFMTGHLFTGLMF